MPSGSDRSPDLPFDSGALLAGILLNLALPTALQGVIVLAGGVTLLEPSAVPSTGQITVLAVSALLHSGGGFAAAFVSPAAPLRHGLIVAAAGLLLHTISWLGVALPLTSLVAQLAAATACLCGAAAAALVRSLRR